MDERGGKMTREERLAAKLRENLRRRKVQARAQAATRTGSPSATPKAADDGLSKAPEGS